MCETSDKTYDIEILLVDKSFVERPDTYNLIVGGRGAKIGQKTFENKTHTPEERIRISKRMKGNKNGIGNKSQKGKKWSDERHKKMSTKHKERQSTPEFKKIHSERMKLWWKERK